MGETTNIAVTTAVNQFMFSICTLVTNWEEYWLMRESFENRGFTDEHCEYLIADNSNGNVFDAYTAINKFLSLSKATYTIVIHQDTECIDSFDMLLDVIKNLDAFDSNWAVCGNAGAIYPLNRFFYIKEFDLERRQEGLPQRVESLDENFLLVKNSARLSVSADLRGFHLYGTDICMIAKFLGYTCYVIPFYINHKSSGSYNNLYDDKDAFIKVYQHKFPAKVVRTPCLKFYLSNSPVKNKLYNSKLMFFWVKAFYKLKYKVTKR